jgi:hypothetical protein
MNRMPPALRRELSKDPYYRACARESAECRGRITWEHALTYAGRQIQERFAIIPLCEFHHSVNEFQDGGGMNKRINVEIALDRATQADKVKYSLLPWKK